MHSSELDEHTVVKKFSDIKLEQWKHKRSLKNKHEQAHASCSQLKTSLQGLRNLVVPVVG